MLFRGMTISETPHIIIGNLYFSQDGDAYIEYKNKTSNHYTRSLVLWCSIQPLINKSYKFRH